MSEFLSSEHALWEVYASTPTVSNRNRLVDFYMEYAKKMALNVYLARAKNSEVAFDDCLSTAIVELIVCIEKFDHQKSIRFTTFSFQRIKGAVHDYISSSVERLSLVNFHRKNAPEHSERVYDFVAELDSFDGLADMILGLATSFYLDESSFSANISGSQVPYTDPQHGIYRNQIKSAVDKLGDPDGLIISSHYFKHMPFSEIAGCLGLTPARVSQLHKRALEKLRLLLA